MKKQTKILLAFIGIGILFSIILENPFVMIAIGATGKVIGGCYGECPAGPGDSKKKTMGACCCGGL